MRGTRAAARALRRATAGAGGACHQPPCSTLPVAQAAACHHSSASSGIHWLPGQAERQGLPSWSHWRHRLQQQRRRRLLHASAPAAMGSNQTLPDELRMPDGSITHKPQEPDPDECCGRGCVQCVWTTYTQALHEYQAAVAVARGCEAPLDPFEALEKRLAQQTAHLRDSDVQGVA